MHIELNKDGMLLIDPVSLLDAINGEAKIQLIQSLSCHDEVIKHVVDQIIDGYTDDGYRAARTFGAQAEPTCALDIAIRRVSKNSGEIAAKEIERMEGEISSLKHRLQSAYEEIEQLRHGREK